MLRKLYLSLLVAALLLGAMIVIGWAIVAVHDDRQLSSLSSECWSALSPSGPPLLALPHPKPPIASECYSRGRFIGDISHVARRWNYLAASFLSLIPALLIWLSAKWLRWLKKPDPRSSYKAQAGQ